ncbi:hypothetical protein [Paracoccus sp. PAR01]|uniref:hypothetical protein n=1 Tax=Paracoccus sp. PAR01 TaxID=2769282 RepID=UPI0017820424|nr:hypothetical protein [Paracoccus sp. PAR01]MBD9526213.1 hypothetical protein [Paracoccus sp. PAR01]
MKLAQTTAKAFLSEVAKLPAPEAEFRLAALHEMRDEVTQIYDGQAAVAAQLTAAADAISGEVFEGSGPLVELAAVTTSQLETAKMFGPELDQPQAEELTERLRALANRLAVEQDHAERF